MKFFNKKSSKNGAGKSTDAFNSKNMDASFGVQDRKAKIEDAKAKVEKASKDVYKNGSHRADVGSSYLEAKIRSIGLSTLGYLSQKVTEGMDSLMILRNYHQQEVDNIIRQQNERELKDFDRGKCEEVEKTVEQKKQELDKAASDLEGYKAETRVAEDAITEAKAKLSTEDMLMQAKKWIVALFVSLFTTVEGIFVFNLIQVMPENIFNSIEIGGLIVCIVGGFLYGTKGIAEAAARSYNWKSYILPGMAATISFGTMAWLRGIGSEAFMTPLNLALMAITIHLEYNYYRKALYHQAKKRLTVLVSKVKQAKTTITSLKSDIASAPPKLQKYLQDKRSDKIAMMTAPIDKKIAKIDALIDSGYSYFLNMIYKPLNSICINGIRELRINMVDAKSDGNKRKEVIEGPIEPLALPDLLKVPEESIEDREEVATHVTDTAPDTSAAEDNEDSDQSSFDIDGIIKTLIFLVFGFGLSSCNDGLTDGVLFVKDISIEANSMNDYSVEDIASFCLDEATSGDFDPTDNEYSIKGIQVFATIIDDREYHDVLSANPLPPAKPALLEVKAQRIKLEKTFFKGAISMLKQLPRPPTAGLNSTNIIASLGEALPLLLSKNFDTNTVIIQTDGFNYPREDEKNSPANLYRYDHSKYNNVAAYFDDQYNLGDLSEIDQIIFFYFPPPHLERQTKLVREFWVRFLEEKGTRVIWMNTIPRIFDNADQTLFLH